MIESVTVMGVSLCMDIPSTTGYQEPPILFVIVESSMTISPVWSLETKKMADPCRASPGHLPAPHLPDCLVNDAEALENQLPADQGVRCSTFGWDDSQKTN
ncbi:hypothetical protein [uncultured Desulfosarcina sp.]|uniref:hypothetical protein n=1 Tax=uncultured Desulfosarcina sp. TaxID=218289 RepID=UPI0029C92E23|nr:hypothetical protein [uncultured Desulfosarcina sp.]